MAVRVAYPMPLVRKHNEDGTRNGTDDRRRSHEYQLLSGLEWRVEALDGVRVQQRHDGKHDQREKSMHEVSKPEFVGGKVLRGGGCGRPQAFGGGDAVVEVPIAILVAIGEGGEAAWGTAGGDEEGGEVPVDDVALAVVGEDGIEELEDEDGACREELD